jgi:hypothetical protein
MRNGNEILTLKAETNRDECLLPEDPRPDDLRSALLLQYPHECAW